MFIPFQFTLANWNISIKYSTLCNCQQISDPTLCTSSQFCQLNMDFECIEVLDYNCSYFNEQTVLYLCSQLDRCYLNNGQCVELNNCSELKGSTNQECYQQSNRCGTSINDICQLTQCDSYKVKVNATIPYLIQDLTMLVMEMYAIGTITYRHAKIYFVKMYQWINVYNMQIYVKLQIIYALGQLAQIYLLKIAPLYGKVLKEMPYNHVFQQMGYVRMQTVQMT